MRGYQMIHKSRGYIDKHFHKSDCTCSKCWYKKNGIIKTKKDKYRRKKKYIPIHIDYFDYITSLEWTKRKENYYKIYNKQCRACGSYKDIDLHHIIYGSFGNELDDNLICLCRTCHKDFHNIKGTQQNMRDNTLQYIKQKQAQLKEIKNYVELL